MNPFDRLHTTLDIMYNFVERFYCLCRESNFITESYIFLSYTDILNAYTH